MRPKAVIANFYGIWPPMGGGQRRIFFLARELSKSHDVDLVTLDRANTFKTFEFSPGLRETIVPAEASFRHKEINLDADTPMAADLAYTLYWDECQNYQNVLSRFIAKADVMISAHPYSAYAVLAARGARAVPFVFDSQNVEIQQKKEVLAGKPNLMEAIRLIEETAIKYADRTVACSEGDADAFAEIYGANRSAIGIVENGVDAVGVPAIDDDGRRRLREKLGLGDAVVAVFGGSFHFPNFHAVDAILEAAKALPHVVFVVLGTVCKYEKLVRAHLPNVLRLGTVDESTKWLAFSLADIGLNPMEQGSGTNIKMFEYAAAGLCVLSTPFGARGSKMDAPGEFRVAELEHFQDAIAALAASPAEERRAIGAAARAKITAVADWGVIGARYRRLVGDARFGQA
jgi:glycosyltransferase involved in cell wall biosynthesis